MGDFENLSRRHAMSNIINLSTRLKSSIETEYQSALDALNLTQHSPADKITLRNRYESRLSKLNGKPSAETVQQEVYELSDSIMDSAKQAMEGSISAADLLDISIKCDAQMGLLMSLAEMLIHPPKDLNHHDWHSKVNGVADISIWHAKEIRDELDYMID